MGVVSSHCVEKSMLGNHYIDPSRVRWNHSYLPYATQTTPSP